MYDYRRMTPVERKAVVQQRLASGYPPHSPPRFAYKGGPLWLITATCFEHQPFLMESSRWMDLLDALFDQFEAAGHIPWAWVILPNHYHWLVQLVKTEGVSDIMRLIHGRFSHQWNGEDRQRGRRIWYRFTDRAIRSEQHFYTTLNYIHYNPVRHGWATSPYAWQPSSVHTYRETCGRDWLRTLWEHYPVRTYDSGWDDAHTPVG